MHLAWGFSASQPTATRLGEQRLCACAQHAHDDGAMAAWPWPGAPAGWRGGAGVLQRYSVTQLSTRYMVNFVQIIVSTSCKPHKNISKLSVMPFIQHTLKQKCECHEEKWKRTKQENSSSKQKRIIQESIVLSVFSPFFLKKSTIMSV